MPEHVHVLVRPTAAVYRVGDFLKSVKESVARRSVAFVRQNRPAFLARMADPLSDGRTAFRFWQRGRGYDRNLWEPAVIWRTIDYIHENPVRRGLSERPEDWAWSSAADFLGVRSEAPVPINYQSLPEDPRP